MKLSLAKHPLSVSMGLLVHEASCDHFWETGEQPDMIASLVRGQLNGGNGFRCPRSRPKVWSRTVGYTSNTLG